MSVSISVYAETAEEAAEFVKQLTGDVPIDDKRIKDVTRELLVDLAEKAKV